MRYGFEVSKICEKTKISHCPTAKEAGHLTSKKYGFDTSKIYTRPKFHTAPVRGKEIIAPRRSRYHIKIPNSLGLLTWEMCTHKASCIAEFNWCAHQGMEMLRIHMLDAWKPVTDSQEKLGKHTVALNDLYRIIATVIFLIVSDQIIPNHSSTNNSESFIILKNSGTNLSDHFKNKSFWANPVWIILNNSSTNHSESLESKSFRTIPVQTNTFDTDTGEHNASCELDK